MRKSNLITCIRKTSISKVRRGVKHLVSVLLSVLNVLGAKFLKCKCAGLKLSVNYSSISQNDIMAEVRRDLWRLWYNLLAQVGLQSTPDCVQAASEYLQEKRIHNLSGKPVPALNHPHSKEVSPHIHSGLPLFQLIPFASHPITEHH